MRIIQLVAVSRPALQLLALIFALTTIFRGTHITADDHHNFLERCAECATLPSRGRKFNISSATLRELSPARVLDAKLTKVCDHLAEAMIAPSFEEPEPTWTVITRRVARLHPPPLLRFLLSGEGFPRAPPTPV